MLCKAVVSLTYFTYFSKYFVQVRVLVPLLFCII